MHTVFPCLSRPRLISGNCGRFIWRMFCPCIFLWSAYRISFHLNCKLPTWSLRDHSHPIPTTFGHCHFMLEFALESNWWKTDYSSQLLCYLPMKASTAAKGPVLVDAKVHSLIAIQSVPSGKSLTNWLIQILNVLSLWGFSTVLLPINNAMYRRACKL